MFTRTDQLAPRKRHTHIRMRIRIFTVFIRLFIGLAILTTLLWQVKFSELHKALISIEPLFLALSVIVLVVGLVIYSLRFRLLLAYEYTHIPLLKAIQIELSGLFIADITPGKIGDLSKIVFFKEKSKAISVVAFERLCDVLAVLILSAIALVALYGQFSYTALVFLGPLILMGLILIFYLLFFKTQYISMFIPSKYHSGIFKAIESVKENIRSKKFLRKIFVPSMFYSLLNWFINSLQIYLLAKAFSVSIPPSVILIIPLILPLSWVPFTIGGVGFIESGIAGILFLAGLPLNIGITVALLKRLLLAVFVYIPGLWVWVNKERYSS